MTNHSEPNRPDPTIKCAKCGKVLEFQDFVGKSPFPSIKLVCNQCADDAAETERLAQGAARADYWRAICPPIYQTTVLDHPQLRMLPTERVESILRWPFGPKGLLVHGPSRRCKTRLVWLLLRRLISEGHSVQAITAHEFSLASSDAHANGRGLEWFRSIIQPDVLFIDDLGQEKLTDRVESDLLAVLERRSWYSRPILTTFNAATDAEMQGKFSPKRGVPIVERLCEFCEEVGI